MAYICLAAILKPSYYAHSLYLCRYYSFNIGFFPNMSIDVEDGHTLHLVVRQPDLPGSLPNQSGTV